MMTFTGKVVISILGAYCEEFLNELFRRKIQLRNIKKRDGIIYATVRRSDYKAIASLSADYCVRVRVVKKKGLYFRLYRYRNRTGVLAGLIFTCIAVLILEKYIWHIEIHNNNRITDAQLLTQLEKHGITLGTLSEEMDTSKAELKLKREFDNIGWINIEINGSRADVYMSEAQFAEEPEIDLKTPCNVISEKDAVIVETEVYSGKLLHTKGSGIAKGSVIVSGTIDDGSGNVILSHSNAKIIGEFTEKLDIYMPFTTLEKELTGNTETEKQLMIFGFNFKLYNDPVSRENKICREEIDNFNFFGMQLPWRVKTSTFDEYKEITVTRTDKDVIKLLDQQIELYCKDIYRDYELIDTEKSFFRDETGIRLTAELKFRGDIGKQQVIYTKEDLTTNDNSSIVNNNQ